MWALIALGIATQTAQADSEGPIDVSVHPGVTCLERETLVHSLETHMHTRVSDDLHAEVRGSAHDPRSAVIALHAGEDVVAQRSFSPGPARCGDFHEAVAVAIAMMVRVADLQTSAPPPVEEAPVEEPVPAAPPSHVAPPPAPLEPPTPGRWSLRGAALFGTRVQGRREGGARIDMAWRKQRLAVHAGAIALVSTEQPIGHTPARFVTRPLGAQVGLGVMLGSSTRWRSELGLFAIVGAVRMRGRGGTNVATLSPNPQLWAAVSADLTVGRRLGDTDAFLFASLSPTYEVLELGAQALVKATGATARARLGRFGAIFALGIELDLGHQGSRASRHE